MERRFTNSDDFEEWLQDQSSSFRMRPSDKVWDAIAKDLGKKRRRFLGWFSLSALALSALSYFIINPINNTDADKPKQQAALPQNNALQAITGGQPGTLAQAGTAAPHQFTVSNRAGNPDGRPGIVRRMPPRRSRLLPSAKTAVSVTNEPLNDQPASFQSQPIDSYADEPAGQSADLSAAAIKATVSNSLPLTVESVTNSYKQPRYKRRHLSYQFYFTPAVSYRKLTENKSYLRSTGAASNAVYVNPSIYDVNNAVTHKPAFGFEMGMTAKYPVSRNIKLTAGAQLNINRYEIKAYNAAPAMTTITLNEPDNHTSSIKTLSKYSNVSGYSEDWLQNFYAQVALPVGAEFSVTGNRNYRLGIATTIQPTYVIGDRSYVLSTDYENYASVPSLVRHWNVNTGLNAFVAYSSGKLNWQIGPQVRYQLLSSFISQYPVKENLFDFGLKVGVSLKK
jgi:hypothetical protein